MMTTHTTNNLYLDTIRRKNTHRPPVWFMRQAGRYHDHYQRLRKQHSFMDLCKKPELACEVTMGPIDDFNFDAAILFSDLLFPLEVLGMGLKYDPSPALDWHLRECKDLERLNPETQISKLMESLKFQGDALQLIRKKLPIEKALLGFVGGPFTLFVYAVEGSHRGDLSSAKAGLSDGRFEGFCNRLVPLLIENMILQAKSGADTVAIFDTCAGELTPEEYAQFIIPKLEAVMAGFHQAMPGFPVLYYSKGTNAQHLDALSKLPFECLGIDWRLDLQATLKRWSGKKAIQGNIDPNWLLLEPEVFEEKIREVFTAIQKWPAELRLGWVCGLGHGVLPQSKVENVRTFIRLQKEMFS